MTYNVSGRTLNLAQLCRSAPVQALVCSVGGMSPLMLACHDPPTWVLYMLDGLNQYLDEPVLMPSVTLLQD